MNGEEKPLYRVTFEDGTTRTLAELRRVGIVAQMVDPAAPDETLKRPHRRPHPRPLPRLRLVELHRALPPLRLPHLPRNSVFVTVAATLITLLTNSMAAFALSKYDFRGRGAVMLLIIATLMIPLSVILVPLYSVISALGLFNSLWGVILPTVATPTGVFLLRQYMLTIPDELLDAARMDKASEWQIYWRIVLPLTAPALAVLAIFSVVWRWNDFLWPLIVLSRKELYTLQVGLNTYAGELNVQWHYILAMTVVTMIPVVLVFVFLQRFITTGIASAGIKCMPSAPTCRPRRRLPALSGSAPPPPRRARGAPQRGVGAKRAPIDGASGPAWRKPGRTATHRERSGAPTAGARREPR